MNSREKQKLYDEKALEAVSSMQPQKSFEDTLSGISVSGMELEDWYWNLFDLLMSWLPQESLSNKGRTLEQFWNDRQAVGNLYMNMTEWVNQDFEAFGLVGNLYASLVPSFRGDVCSVIDEKDVESFSFKPVLERFEKEFFPEQPPIPAEED